MSAERNASGAFSLLLSPDYRFATIFKKNTDDARTWAVYHSSGMLRSVDW